MRSHPLSLSMLEEMGFTNISTNSLGDLRKGWIYKDGAVKEVSIEGNVRFSANDLFERNAAVVISYHSFPD